MLKIGDRLANRYRITARLGTGGMAEVFEANDFVQKKIVAIKIMKEELLGDIANINRFNNEVTACASMRHPNIIKVYDRGVFEDRPYMAYEFIKGSTLDEKIKYYSKLSIEEAIQIIIQLSDAVNYIHNHGIIHRDIKPGNIFYLADGTVKVSDFGIAVDAKIDETKTEQGIMGSIYYLAPEICQGKQSTVQSDIYSIGVTFYELITGRLPFEDGRATDIALAKINKNFPSPKRILPSCPDEIEAIILKACSKNPKDRYGSAIEIKNDLENYINNSGKPVEKKGIFSRFFGFK